MEPVDSYRAFEKNQVKEQNIVVRPWILHANGYWIPNAEKVDYRCISSIEPTRVAYRSEPSWDARAEETRGRGPDTGDIVSVVHVVETDVGVWLMTENGYWLPESTLSDPRAHRQDYSGLEDQYAYACQNSEQLFTPVSGPQYN